MNKPPPPDAQVALLKDNHHAMGIIRTIGSAITTLFGFVAVICIYGTLVLIPLALLKYLL